MSILNKPVVTAGRNSLGLSTLSYELPFEDMMNNDKVTTHGYCMFEVLMMTTQWDVAFGSAK